MKQHGNPGVRLQRLVGQALWGAELAGEMVMLQLGDKIAQPKRSGRIVTVGTFSLHIQCPWRLSSPTGAIVAGSNDATIDALRRYCDVAAMVRDVVLDKVHGLNVRFQDDHRLAIFPATSAVDEYSEYWRLLSNGDDEFQLMAGPLGLE